MYICVCRGGRGRACVHVRMCVCMSAVMLGRLDGDARVYLLALDFCAHMYTYTMHMYIQPTYIYIYICCNVDIYTRLTQLC